ncbi:polysaccharide biosynthesis/export family protein [Sphingomonas sp.]|uniref:polysaccharide biosynthesis/export family protein n=1 Tax=Sphingomonas sp. TaxID=28214 RepID=UPI0025CDF4FD|nr:polysaccharide biosynthesis/export family protein [Sphingomonas sp.]
MTRLYSFALLFLCAACQTIPPGPVASGERFAYRLGTGDRVLITVFGETSLTGEFTLDGTGTIAYPLLGRIAAATKTTTELGDEISTRLGAKYIRNPRVTVALTSYRPIYILGEVARSGEFPYTEGLNAFALVAKAGGFTFRANRTAIFIRHENETEEKAYPLNGALVIRPGDTVRVGERYF